MSQGRPDFKRVGGAALSHVDKVLSRWLPDGKKQGAEYVAKNPRRSDARPGSFSVNCDTGVWADFATGDKGADLVALVAYLEGVKQGEACNRLAAFLGIEGDAVASTTRGESAKRPGNTSELVPIFPVPEEKRAGRPARLRSLPDPSAEWEYLDAEGRLLMRVVRFDLPDREGRPKEYRPQTFGKKGGKPPAWYWGMPGNNRPLYGLDHLARFRAGVPALLCEGEKAADAARELFPDNPVLCWPGGAKAIDKADWRPLRGRDVWYWPDHDEPGRQSAAALLGALRKVGAGALSILDVELFAAWCPGEDEGRETLQAGTGNDGWSAGSDAADALAAGWRSAHIRLLLEKGLLKESAVKGALTRSQPISRQNARYRSGPGGLEFYDMKADAWRRLGNRLDVLAKSRDENSRSWGVLVSFDDLDGVAREWNIPQMAFATDGGAEVVRGLLDRGYNLLTDREAKRRLLEYLGDNSTMERVRLVHRMGWHGSAFLLPDRVLGKSGETLHYYSGAPALCKLSQKGTVDEWRDNVASKCQGNSRPVFALCAAFAGPLLDVFGSETCGFHFVGDSSLGKSTLLKVAASVYGDPDEFPRSWRSTDNALEATAAAHSDCLLVLDEIGQIEPHIIGATVYMLGNGEGKSRAAESGRGRGVEHRWRLVFLSSGEKTLQDHMAEAHKKPMAGMESRLLTLPASVHEESEQQRKHGIYEQCEGYSGGAELSAALLAACSKYHGTAIYTLLEKLANTAERVQVAEWFQSFRKDFLNTLLENSAGGQVGRAADKFALVAFAGEYATSLGLTGWESGHAADAVMTCARAWLAFRGTAGNLEDKQALDHIREMLLFHGESNFSRIDKDGSSPDDNGIRTLKRWGWVRKGKGEFDDIEEGESVFFLTSDGFKEMCRGFNPRRVARLLFDIGVLDTDKEQGRLTKKVGVPGVGRKKTNCYVVRFSSLLSKDC